MWFTYPTGRDLHMQARGTPALGKEDSDNGTLRLLNQRDILGRDFPRMWAQ